MIPTVPCTMENCSVKLCECQSKKLLTLWIATGTTSQTGIVLSGLHTSEDAGCFGEHGFKRSTESLLPISVEGTQSGQAY